MKVAADGKKKFTFLTAAPADPTAPTATELEAGIDGSCQILDSDANWTNAASDTIAERTACQKGNSQALGASNYDLALTFIREWDAAGGPDATLDAAYQAAKEKGTTLWVYLRESDKDSTEPWEAADEIYLGGEVQTDSPTRVDNTGNLKRRIVFLPQTMIENVAVAAGV